MKPVTKFTTTNETADALRICPATLRRWTADGRVPCVRLSARVVRYNLEAVLAALSKKEKGHG